LIVVIFVVVIIIIIRLYMDRGQQHKRWIAVRNIVGKVTRGLALGGVVCDENFGSEPFRARRYLIILPQRCVQSSAR
jgi:hypothetical protein